jgi:hypothetical protein
MFYYVNAFELKLCHQHNFFFIMVKDNPKNRIKKKLIVYYISHGGLKYIGMKIIHVIVY